MTDDPIKKLRDMGINLEPDIEPRNGPFHKRIDMIRNIPNTRTGHHLRLECGHEVQTYGDLSHAGGVIYCAQCATKANR